MDLTDNINFQVNGKLRSIELYLGDITKLKVKDKVDLLLVSAFPGNYAPRPNTLIGALETKLHLSVRQLSKNKAEDLRRDFHCWISKDLPDESPFKRILCFEQGFSDGRAKLENPAALIGAVFRALFTALKDKDWSMITPLLATGNQGTNKKMMIRVMVKACSSWIMAGMPLECMKIVIFRDKKESIIGKYDREAMDEFSKLKSELNWNPSTETILIERNDVFFIYVKEDESDALLFIKNFETLISEDKRLINIMCIDKSETNIKEKHIQKYQDEMIKSKKVVLFLTPTLIGTPKAVELYNLALCLSHRKHKNLLTAVYLKAVDVLPEYMTLNQYINCRTQHSEKNTEIRFVEACETLFKTLKENDNSMEDKNNKTDFDDPSKIVLNLDNQSRMKNFDIFISYCHKDKNIANIILSFLKLSLPDKKIFFDLSGIKSGYSWQETLYYGINNSKIVLALLSENYLQSPMCREEFSISVSQHQSPKYSTHLLPVWISKNELEEITKKDQCPSIKSFFFVQKILIPKFNIIDCNSLDETIKFLSFSQELLRLFINPILNEDVPRKVSSFMPIINLEEAALSARTEFIKSLWLTNNSKNISPVISKIGITKSPKLPTNILIACHEDDLSVAENLKFYILSMAKDLNIKFSSMGPQSEGYKNMNDFEAANLIIILINPYYVSTKSCLTQLQMALSLQRRQPGSELKFCPLILESLPSQPSYIHLIPSRFKADDEIFNQLFLKFKDSSAIQKIKQYSSKGYDNEKVLTSQTKIMLYFAAVWITNLFTKEFFLAPKTPVLYSTFDFIKTSFNEQMLSDVQTISSQIEYIIITEDEINSSKQFLFQNNDVMEGRGSDDDKVRDHTGNNLFSKQED